MASEDHLRVSLLVRWRIAQAQVRRRDGKGYS